MNKTWLLLGSNMGNSKEQLSIARKYIHDSIGKILRKSALYQTAAWGKTDQPDFINQVIIVETRLPALETMQTILGIENKMGRKRTIKNAPRIIDIDILFFNKEIISTDLLTVPHPHIRERRFVLTPLNSLSPLLIHPVYNKSIHRLLIECTDKLNVKKM
ncbi:MAG: 2-amino-4-hydroxy-6-hydroxymethyldihydropteridine diphosphokinase [Bacteroidetes bacterium]|jgi:2-amino-4-hydroxy-6-hydroxymethyldihydropteridine diphosphokinase|nr:2-amino-4-hydroxy-6-hydroxymethyldihydropteridine diphosphokinase [Bacteroidota bacterium]